MLARFLIQKLRHPIFKLLWWSRISRFESTEKRKNIFKRKLFKWMNLSIDIYTFIKTLIIRNIILNIISPIFNNFILQILKYELLMLIFQIWIIRIIFIHLYYVIQILPSVFSSQAFPALATFSTWRPFRSSAIRLTGLYVLHALNVCSNLIDTIFIWN